MKLDFGLQGWKELDRELAKMDSRVEKRIGLTGLKAGGRVIIKEARRLAPKKTGTLRKSIKQKAPPKKPGRIFLDIFTAKGKGQRFDAWYSHFVEFGYTATGPKGDKPGTFKQFRAVAKSKATQKGKGGATHVPAQPFMRPALHTRWREAIKVTGERIFQLIVKEIKEPSKVWKGRRR